MEKMNKTRIDRWLWFVRIYKTRTKATNACTRKRVSVDGITIKPSYNIRENDLIQVRKGIIKFVYKVKKDRFSTSALSIYTFTYR